VCVCHIRFR